LYFNGLDDEWGGKDAATYLSETRDRYQSNYVSGLESGVPSESDLNENQSQSQKRSADSAFADDDDKYEEHLKKRAGEPSGFELEFDVYMSNPNGNPGIRNTLSFWRDNPTKFANLRRMASDVLAVPPSGCAVERQFSVSGRIATWQRNRLSEERISEAMIYKAALKREGKLKEDQPHVETEQMEDDGNHEWMNDGKDVLPEWSKKWWLTQVSSSRKK
jgi:hAT family C-terminal dimerisation region